MGSYTVIGALQKVYIPYRSLVEALYTLNSPPVVSFKYRIADPWNGVLGWYGSGIGVGPLGGTTEVHRLEKGQGNQHLVASFGHPKLGPKP